MCFMYMDVLSACTFAYQKKASDSMELQIQTVMSRHVGAGNCSQDLWKSSQCCELLSPYTIFLLVQVFPGCCSLQSVLCIRISLLYYVSWFMYTTCGVSCSENIKSNMKGTVFQQWGTELRSLLHLLHYFAYIYVCMWWFD